MRLTTELDTTTVARWYRSARFRTDPARSGTSATTQRLNWHTRTRYYETLVGLLSATGGVTDGLARDEIAAAAGQQRPSTFYYLVSPKSPGSLAGALQEASPHRLYKRRPGERILDLLVLETKVWSYWPYREGWAGALDDLAVTDRWLAAEGLVRVLADWAAHNRELATAGGYAPPVAAVEDLLLLAETGEASDGDGDGAVSQVRELLTTVVRTALSGTGIGAGFVLGSVHAALSALMSCPRAPADELTTEAVDLLTQLEHAIPALDEKGRAQMADELGPRLRAVLAQLGAGEGPPGAPPAPRMDGPPGGDGFAAFRDDASSRGDGEGEVTP